MSESPRSLEELRQRLLDQLIYLVDELEALGVIIDRVPEPVLEGHPLPGELSIKEMYALLAISDEQVRLPVLRRIVAEDHPSIREVEVQHQEDLESWNRKPIREILDRLIEARRNLHAFLDSIDSQTWLRTGRWGTEDRVLFALVHSFIQHDVDLLRSIALRLHVSRL